MSDNDDGKFISTMEAWEKAEAMLDGSPTDDTPSATVEDTPVETPEEIVDDEQLAETDDIPNKLSDLNKKVEQPEPTKVEGSPELGRDTVLDVNGKTMTLGDLIDSGMREDDYTRKTQELAERTRQLEKADELYSMLQGDTVGTIAQLAFEANLIDEAQFKEVATSTVNPAARSLLKDNNPVDLEKQISEVVQSQLQSVLSTNPALRQVADNQRKAQILQLLGNIETNYDQSFDDDDRTAILERAVQDGEPNLELTYLRMQKELDAQRANVARIEDAAGGKKSVTNVPKETNVRPASTKEAFEIAEQKLSLRGG